MRESTRAMRRRALTTAVILALGVVGPIFIALSIFPDRPTAVGGSGEQRCAYDAAPVERIERLAPVPTPRPIIAGRATNFVLPILNSGTCDWDASVTLYREGGSLPDTPPFISATTTMSKALFTAQIPFTAPATIGAYNSTWRMHTPDNRSFGAPLAFSIVTYREGFQPVYPADPPITFAKIMTLVVFLLPGLLGLWLAIERSGRFVREFYSLKNDVLGRDHVLRLVFNLRRGVSATVKDGDFKAEGASETIEKIGGPGSLSIHSDMAALLERGGGFSRIAWPGTTVLAPFERVRTVIDLRQLNRTKTETAYTKDGIEVKTEVGVSFKLMKQKDDEHIPPPEAKVSWWDLLKAWIGLKVKPSEPPEGPPVSPEAIRAIVYTLPAGVNWDGTVSSGIGDVIPQKMLDELWAPEDPDRNPRREMVEELFDKAKEKQRKSGIELIDLSVGPLNVPDEVVKQRREFWRTIWDKVSKITEAEGEAEALRQQQTARAEAQAEMIQTIMHSFRMMAFSGAAQPSRQVALKLIEIVAHTMKAALEDPLAERSTSAEAAMLLERLQARHLLKP